MAVNTTAYFPNVASANNKVVGATSTAAGSTIYTAPGANAYMRVKCFTVTLHTLSGGAATDWVRFNLKIGSSGNYTFTLAANATLNEITTLTVSSSTVGFEPSFLQPGETIVTTIGSVVAGGMTYVADVSVTLEDFFI